MRGDFEDKAPDSRRFEDDEDLYFDAIEGPILHQSPDTLKPGFNWISHFQRQHPGYEFMRFDEIPFHEDLGDLKEARVALVSAAGVYMEGQKPFNIAPGVVDEELIQLKFKEAGDPTFRVIESDADPSLLRLAHPYMEASAAEEDINVVFPISRMAELTAEEVVGEVAPRHISFMGYLPFPDALADSIGEAADILRNDRVDAAILLPGELLSHQTMAVIQKELESAGITTVAIALCRDLIEAIGVPRAVHYRYPFGYTFGYANDAVMQLRILKDALRTLEEADEPGTIIDLPYEWIQS